MRTLVCRSCGLATTKEFSACPACRRKDLSIQDSFNTSSIYYHCLTRREAAAGTHPLVSLVLVAFMATGLTLLFYTWMYPIH